jgi:LacI family transcriptional regulator
MEALYDTPGVRGSSRVVVSDVGRLAGVLSGPVSTLHGIFANDQMAIGVLRAMQEPGRQIPDEVSVVGFDDIPEAPYLMPPLTTIRQDFDEVGCRSFRLLLATIETGGPVTRGSLVQPQLVVRASTSAPQR